MSLSNQFNRSSVDPLVFPVSQHFANRIAHGWNQLLHVISPQQWINQSSPLAPCRTLAGCQAVPNDYRQSLVVGASFVVPAMRNQNLVGHVWAGCRQKPLVQNSKLGQASVPPAMLGDKEMWSTCKLTRASQQPMGIRAGD